MIYLPHYLAILSIKKKKILNKLMNTFSKLGKIQRTII